MAPSITTIRTSSAARRPGRRGRARTAVLALAAVAMALTVSACGGSSGAGQSRTLTVVNPEIPQTLDPVKANTNDAWLEQLAYEPLIVEKADGSLAPGLATSWSYQGSDNKSFVLKLRRGVKFSDGSPLTADGVVAYLKYVAHGGALAPFFAGETFAAVDSHTVRITSEKPNPALPQLLTQRFDMGDVISPQALRSPSKLGTRTFGAGPYRLDPSQTVAGDHYTYVPNPNYYDASSVHWQKVVVKVITNAQATLNALKTGAADVAVGDPSTASAAKQAGLRITGAPLLWTGVILADRQGSMAKPLGDVRVRQALNYATDRDSIVSGVFKGNAKPTAEPTVPGGYGDDPNLRDAYGYDPAKAKELLAAAGYPGGFTIKLATSSVQSQNLVAQALAQQWKRVGVTVELTDYANADQFSAALNGGKFPAYTTAFGQLPLWLEGPALFLPTALWNPLHTADERLSSLYDQEAASSGDKQQSLDRQLVDYLVRQAWFVPVASTDLVFFSRSSVTGVTTSAKAPNLYLYDIRPAGK